MPDTIERPDLSPVDIDDPDIQALLVAAHLEASVDQLGWALKRLGRQTQSIRAAVEKAVADIQSKLPALLGWPEAVYVSLFEAKDGSRFTWPYPDVHSAVEDLVDEMAKGHENEFVYDRTIVLTRAGAAFTVDLSPLVEEARRERTAEAVEWRGRMQRTPPV